MIVGSNYWGGGQKNRGGRGQIPLLFHFIYKFQLEIQRAGDGAGWAPSHMATYASSADVCVTAALD